jgi:hypothetical protein
MLTAAGFGDRDFVAYTPEGCYAGSNGIDRRMSVFNGSRYEPISLGARKAMFSPSGFAALFAR